MFLLVMVALAALVSILSGGRVSNLRYLEFRFAWLVLLAAAIKVVCFTGLRYTAGISDSAMPYYYLLSLALVALFVILNIGMRGFALVGLGLLGNILAVSFNGGYMPVKAEYVPLIATQQDLANIEAGLPAFNYVSTTPETNLVWLSDIFLMPEWIPMTRVFSVGDVLITIGGIYFVVYYLMFYHKSSSFRLKKYDGRRKNASLVR